RKQMLGMSARELFAIDAGAVEPFLGAYHSEALGDLTLRLVDGALVADLGEFDTVLGALDSGSTRFVTTTPPFPGLEGALEPREGAAVVLFSLMGTGEAYEFEQR